MSLMLGMLTLLLMPQVDRFDQGASVGAGSAAVIGGGATGTVVFESVPGDYDQAPRWIRPIEPSQVGSVFPTRARESGRDGTSTINCTLTVDGGFRNCRVQLEAPANMGFGAATLALAPDLNIQPAMKNGQPVESEIRIRANFQGPGVPTGSLIRGTTTTGMQRVVVNPPWVSAPAYENVVAAYPAAARAAGLGGRVSLYCTFRADGSLEENCLIENEQPAGYGFGEAALALSRQFRAADSIEGASIEGRGVKLPVTFSARMLQPTTVAAGEPVLIGLPTDQEFAAAFPARARDAAVGQGQADVSCTVGQGGVPTNCSVASESPVGLGFAAAAINLAPKFRLNLWSSDGLPTIGGRVRIPVQYDYRVQEQAAR